MPHLVHSPHALLVTILKRDNEQFIFLVYTFQPWVLLLQLQVLGLFAYLCFRSRSRSYANCNVCIRNMLMPICLFSLLRTSHSHMHFWQELFYSFLLCFSFWYFSISGYDIFTIPSIRNGDTGIYSSNFPGKFLKNFLVMNGRPMASMICIYLCEM